MASVTVGQVALLGRLHLPRTVGVACIQDRKVSSIALPNYKRGKGGRSSFSGHVVTIFGANGFLGTRLINRFGKIGSKIIVPYRHDPHFVKHLKLASDLGQMQFVPYHLKDEESLRACMKYSDVVINVINRDIPTKTFSYEDLNVTGARSIARIAKEMDVETFVHFSALNASPKPEPIFLSEGSEFLKTKYYGELAVREEFPEAIVFRPSDIYGSGDRFLMLYTLAKGSSSFMYDSKDDIVLWNRGEKTVKQPVYVSDVADGVMSAVRNADDCRGQTYEAVGPDRFYLTDLVRFFFFCMRRPHTKVGDIPKHIIYRKKNIDIHNIFVNKRIDNIYRMEREYITDVTTGLPTLADLGVKSTRIQDQARYEYMTFRKDRNYDADLGQFAEAPDPPKETESHLHPSQAKNPSAVPWVGFELEAFSR